jgi:hypothetical protein
MTERIIVYGGAVKALTGDGLRVGGYLVEWGDAGERDLQRERFISETDFALDWYGERPLLFQHGLDDGIGAAKIGTIRRLSRDDKGLWMEAILDERNEYIEYVRRLIERGALGLSSGSLPHLVRVDADGTIRRFPIVEGSLTHTPADPRTRVTTLKGLLPLTPNPSPTQAGRGRQFVGTAQALSGVTAGKPTDERGGELETIMMAIEAALGINLTAEQRAALAAKLGELQPAAAKAVVPHSRVSGFTGISDVKDLRYHHLKAQDLVFGAHILNAAHRAGLSMGGASEGFLRAAADKTLRAADHGGFGDGFAVKAAIKADEVFASNLSSNGQEWVGVAYETQLWEAVREAPIYRALIDMGMMEVEIPRGFSSIYIPTEGTDPTFYSLAEQNDETSDERLPVTGKSSTLTATRRQLTPGFIGARVSFSDIMEEDSLIPVLPFLRAKMEQRGQEIIEYLMINGDTETGTTNINYDGSAVSALVDAKGRGPVYTALDGFLKLPLVTTTLARAVGAGFDETDFLETIKLLPAAQQVALERMAFITDPATHLTALDISVVKSRDTFHPATVENGRLARMYGVKLFRSGQMGLADTDGKITYNAAGTKGRLLLVRADQWALGRKRDMRTEIARDIDAQATVVVTTMRFGMAARSTTGGAALTYGITV